MRLLDTAELRLLLNQRAVLRGRMEYGTVARHSLTDVTVQLDRNARSIAELDLTALLERVEATQRLWVPLEALANEIEDSRIHRPGMQRRREWAKRLRGLLSEGLR